VATAVARIEAYIFVVRVVNALNEKDFRFYGARAQVKELIYDLIEAGAVVLH
jgi:hypothetical protein